MSSTYLDTDFSDYDEAQSELLYNEWVVQLPVALQNAIYELESLHVRSGEWEAFITIPDEFQTHSFYESHVALSEADKAEVLKDLKTTDTDPGWWEEVNNVVKNLKKDLKG
jgi:hypothetical protein